MKKENQLLRDDKHNWEHERKTLIEKISWHARGLKSFAASQITRTGLTTNTHWQSGVRLPMAEEMAEEVDTVSISILGRDYQISCPPLKKRPYVNLPGTWISRCPR